MKQITSVFQTIHLPRRVPSLKHDNDSIYTNIILSSEDSSFSINLNNNVCLLNLIHHTPYPKTLTLEDVRLDEEPLLYLKRLFENALITKVNLNYLLINPYTGVRKVDNSGVFQALTLLPTLRKLTVKYNEFIHNDFGTLHWLLLSSNNLTSVCFSRVSFTQASCDDLTMLFHGLKHSKIERLSVKMCEYPTHFDVQRLLDNVTTLREFEIADHGDHLIHGLVLQNLVTCIATHPTLKKVFINCERFSNGEFLYTFVSLLAHNKSLEVVDLSTCTMISTSDSFNMNCAMLKQNTTLQVFKHRWFITENYMIPRIADLYQNVHTLRNLSINFCLNAVMDLQPFSDFIASTTTLTKLDCGMQFRYSFKDITGVIDAITANTTLRSLTFFIDTGMYDESETVVKRLLVGLATNTTLTNLKLQSFIGYDEVNSELVHLIKTNTTLVKLNTKGILYSSKPETIINALACNTTLQTLKCKDLDSEDHDRSKNACIHFINNNTTLLKGSESILAIESVDDRQCYVPQMKIRNYALNLTLFDLLLPIASTFE